jgi:hypothetical protein
MGLELGVKGVRGGLEAWEREGEAEKSTILRRRTAA